VQIRPWIQDGLNEFLRKRGKEIIPTERVYEWQRIPTRYRPEYRPMEIPAEASHVLQPANPRLVELQERYAKFDPAVTTPLVWLEGHLRAEDIPYFRGDNAYVWQTRNGNFNTMGYAMAYYYALSIDRHGLFDRLTEDDSFGNYTFDIGGRKVSRDLLDSIIELYFLDKHLDIFARRDFTWLDIGAGYGRLAYRAATVVDGLKNYFCTDAVAFSTFLSDYYLRHRGVHRKAQAVPLDEIEAKLQETKPDLVTNIHSWSECRVEAIDWWVRLLAKTGVRHLMIAPNTTDCGGEFLRTNDLKDFSGIVTKYGYRQVAKEPKYRDAVVQRFAISPTWHFLFELS
jgi:hypothetical protein